MEIPTVAAIRNETKVFQFNLCLVCQKSTSAQLVAKPLQTSVKKARDSMLEVSQYDSKYQTVAHFLTSVSLETLLHQKSSYHRDCYQEVTNSRTLRKKRTSEIPDATPAKRPTRSQTVLYDKSRCIICQTEKTEKVIELQTDARDEQLKKAIYEIWKDQEMMIRYENAFDGPANDVKYHRNCWRFYVTNAKCENIDTSREERKKVAIELELIRAIENKLIDGAVLSMSDILGVYKQHLADSNIPVKTTDQTLRRHLESLIKEEISEEVQFTRTVVNETKKIYLSSDQCQILKLAIDNATNATDKSSLKSLWDAAKVLRKDMMETRKKEKWTFRGSVRSDHNTIPEFLQIFLEWIYTGGRELSGYRDANIARDATTTGQVIMYNLKSDRQVQYKADENTGFRHRYTMPHIVGAGLVMRRGGAKKKLIDMFADYGLCTPSVQCLILETSIANAVIKNMDKNNGVFIPGNLSKGVFISFHLDNTDFAEDLYLTTHNLILVGFQCKTDAEIVDMHGLDIDSTSRSLTLLPNRFNQLVDCGKPDSSAYVQPESCKNFKPNTLKHEVEEPKKRNLAWSVIKATEIYLKDAETSRSDVPNIFKEKAAASLGELKIPSWSAYNSVANTEVSTIDSITGTILSPLINGNAHDISAVYTGLLRAEALTKATLSLQGKTVISLDLDLYDRASYLVRSRPDLRDRYVLRLGELHIVFAYVRAIGSFIESSGIPTSWEKSHWFGSTICAQVLHCTHMKRALTAHENTLICFYVMVISAMFEEGLLSTLSDKLTSALAQVKHALQNKDYSSVKSINTAEILPIFENDEFQAAFKEFESRQIDNMQYRWISIYIKMVEKLFLFIYASRFRKWKLHLATCEELLPMIISTDRIKYRKSLPLYLADMHQLEKDDPYIWEELLSGEYSVQTSSVPFTAKGNDHSGEQVNKILKVAGGLVGISSNENARTRFFLSAPFLATIEEEMKEMCAKPTTIGVPTHHQLNEAHTKRQAEMINKLLKTLAKSQVSFEVKQETKMYNIATKVFPPLVTEDVLRAPEVGEELYFKFVEERMSATAKQRTIDKVTKVNLKLFSSTNKKVRTKHEDKIITIKEERSLFARCAIVANSKRDLNMSDIIGNYELQVVPRSLMDHDGSLHLESSKSDLIGCLTMFSGSANASPEAGAVSAAESVVTTEDVVQNTNRPIHLIDAMALVQKLSGDKVKVANVLEFANLFLDLLRAYTDCAELHLVFDNYYNNSLKSATRQKRQKNKKITEFVIKDDTDLQKVKMSEFLSHIDTKRALTVYLTEKAISYLKAHNVRYAISSGNKTVTNIEQVMLDVNTQEEADTLLVLHGVDADKRHDGEAEINVVSSDTDVLILLTAFAQKFSTKQIFMTTSKSTKINVNAIATRLGDKKSAALIGFHSFTGSDVCGKFVHKGKKTWWSAYNDGDDELYDAFITLADNENLSDKTFTVLERFISEVYSPTARKIITIPEIRYWLFSKKSLESEKLPPTRGALKEHILRASYQASVWAQADVAEPKLPEIELCGWKNTDEGYVPKTSATPIAPDAVLNLVRCGCGGKCSTKRCTCLKHKLSCTDLCRCTELCENTDNIRECDHINVDDEDAADLEF